MKNNENFKNKPRKKNVNEKNSKENQTRLMS